MSRDMSMFALAGYLKRISEMPEDRMLKSRPRELRKIKLLDNKCNPDFYIVGRVAGFIGLKVLCRWYPVLGCNEGREAFLKGLADAEAETDPRGFEDIIGDLWRVRRTDPPVFDAALYLKHGGVRQAEILSALFMRGQSELEKLKKAQACEMEFYGLIDDEWMDHRKHSKEEEREIINAQL